MDTKVPSVERELVRLRRAITSVCDRIASLEGDVGDNPSEAMRIVLAKGLAYQRARLRSLEGELGKLEAAAAQDEARQLRVPGT